MYRQNLGDLLYKLPLHKPSCAQLVAFIETGSCLESIFNSSESIEDLKLLDNFVPLGLYDGDKIIHTFIHIAHGVCIGKLGTDKIFFHTAQDIATVYTNLVKKPLEIKIRHIGISNNFNCFLNAVKPYMHHYTQKLYSALIGQDLQLNLPENKSGDKVIFPYNPSSCRCST